MLEIVGRKNNHTANIIIFKGNSLVNQLSLRYPEGPDFSLIRFYIVLKYNIKFFTKIYIRYI